MRRRPFGTIVLLVGLSTSAPSRAEIPADRFVDPRDGRSYRTIEVAESAWFAENLAFAAPGSYCFEDREEECERRGRLYPYLEAAKACPPGWHLSTEAEWQALERDLGLSASELEQTKGRGAPHGDRLKTGGGTGLDIPLAGWRRPDGSYAAGNGNDLAAALWTATEAGPEVSWHRDVSSARSVIWRSAVDWPYALSVRCVADDLDRVDHALGVAWKARDLATLLSFYDDRVVAAWTDRARSRSLDDVRSFWQETWSDPSFAIVAGELREKRIEGDLAFYAGSSSFRWTRDGRTVVDHGEWTTLWVRRLGRWRIAHETWNRLERAPAP